MEHFDPFLTIADEIVEMFTPHCVQLPFCDHRECEQARRTDPTVWVQAETAQRIAAHIRQNHALKGTGA